MLLGGTHAYLVILQATGNSTAKGAKKGKGKKGAKKLTAAQKAAKKAKKAKAKAAKVRSDRRFSALLIARC